MKRIKALIVDANSDLLWAIFRLLESDPEVQVIGLAATAAASRALARVTPPDVVLIDLSLPCGLSYLLIRQFRALCPESRIYGMCLFDDPIYAEAARLAGAEAILSKERLAADLLPAIHRMDAVCHR